MSSNVAHSQKVLFNWPLARQEWIDCKFVKHDDHDESWVELFIDLVYVLLLSSLAHTLISCDMSLLLFFRTSLLFWIICLTRQAVDEYTNRFFCHDMLQKTNILLYAFGLCIQVYSFAILAAENHSENDHSGGNCGTDSFRFSSGFAIGVLITRICLIIFYMPVLYHHPKAREQFKFDLCRWTFTSLLMIILVIINSNDSGSDNVNFVIFSLTVVFELVVWLVSRVFFRHYFIFPVELDLLQSRWGVWVMLIVGESFLQLLTSIETAVEHSDGQYDFIWFIFLSMLLLYSIGMQYFDACHVEWFLHALTKSAVAGVSWVWLHVPMTYYLFRMGLWLNVLANAYANHSLVSRSDAGMFSACLGIVTALLTFIRMSNAMPDSSTSLVYHVVSMEFRIIATYATRFVVAALHIVVGFVGIRDPLELLVIHCGVSILTTCIDIYNSMKHNEALRKEEEARQDSNLKLKSLRQFPRQWSRLQLYSKESVLQLNLLDDRKNATSSDSQPSVERDDSSSKEVVTIDLQKEIRKAVLQSQRSAHFDGLLMRGEDSMKRLAAARKLSVKSKSSTMISTSTYEPSSKKAATTFSRLKFPAMFKPPSRTKVHVLENIEDESFEGSGKNSCRKDEREDSLPQYNNFDMPPTSVRDVFNGRIASAFALDQLASTADSNLMNNNFASSKDPESGDVILFADTSRLAPPDSKDGEISPKS